MSNRVRSTLMAGFGAILLLGAVACSPKVGSDAWCQAMKDKPKGDWSANDAGEFAKHCVFK